MLVKTAEICAVCNNLGSRVERSKVNDVISVIRGEKERLERHGRERFCLYESSIRSAHRGQEKLCNFFEIAATTVLLLPV